MNWYGQLLQDKWVVETLGYKQGGYFLDLGAFDGEIFSNTLVLERDLFWRGICVEAGENNFKKLAELRKCTCLNMVLSSRDGEEGFCENWTVGKVDIAGKMTPAISLPTLLRLYDVPKRIDYISLDVEGQEYEVLNMFPFRRYRSSLWTIEHNQEEDDGARRDLIREIMYKHNYKIAQEYSFEDWFYDNEYTY